MDFIHESFGRLSELSDDDLKSLKDSIISEFETVKSQDLSQEVANTLVELADMKDAVVGEQSKRVEQAAQLAAQVEEASSRMAAEEATDNEVADVAEAAMPAMDEEEKDPLTGEPLPADKPGTEEEDDPNKKVYASESVEETLAELPAETSVETLIESEAAVEETAAIEEIIPEAELASEEIIVEEIAEAELASEEVAKESSEEPVTAQFNSEELDLTAPEGQGPADAPKLVAHTVITAGADIPHVPAGSELPNLKAVANAIIARQKGMGRTSGGDGEFHSVATFTTTFPEGRYLSRNDVEINREKIDSVINPAALTAAGGMAAPVEVRYELFGLGSTARPVKDSLAVFGAERGGIRFVTPPVIGDVTAAVSLWTLQDDIDASTAGAPDPVKPCLRVLAGSEVVVNIDAIPLCLTFGNMGARAYPELVERHTELAMVNHARFAETRILTRIGTLSTAVTADNKLGAARDIFGQIDQAAAGYRNRHRIADDSTLRVIFPEWFKNALRADLSKQIPGDGLDDTFGLSESMINAWFKVRNINVTWTMDGETGQIMGTQAGSNAALNSFPSTVIWYLFAEGTFLFLDGGTLDLGLVRDSTLNGTNDYKIFLETFEGVAKVGVESLKVTSDLSILGASAATVS